MTRGRAAVLSVVRDRGCANQSLCEGVIGEQRFPHPRGEFDGPVGGTHADAPEHIDEVGVGINLVQSACHQQTPVPTTLIQTGSASAAGCLSIQRLQQVRSFVVRVVHPTGDGLALPSTHIVCWTKGVR